MAGRNQHAKPKQEMEGAGEQREAQQLHQKDGVDHAGSGNGGRYYCPQYAPTSRHRATATPLPNRPFGLTIKTTAMMTKTTVEDASGQRTLVRPSMQPRLTPVTIA